MFMHAQFVAQNCQYPHGCCCNHDCLCKLIWLLMLGGSSLQILTINCLQCSFHGWSILECLETRLWSLTSFVHISVPFLDKVEVGAFPERVRNLLSATWAEVDDSGGLSNWMFAFTTATLLQPCKSQTVRGLMMLGFLLRTCVRAFKSANQNFSPPFNSPGCCVGCKLLGRFGACRVLRRCGQLAPVHAKGNACMRNNPPKVMSQSWIFAGSDGFISLCMLTSTVT